MVATIEELRTLLAGAAAHRPHLTSRLEKAACLVLLRPIRQVAADTWLVGSEDGLRFYRVEQGDCDAPTTPATAAATPASTASPSSSTET